MTFFPPFIILVAFLVLSLVDQETFLGVINNINNWIIKNLGWAASILALAIVIVAVVAMFSKFGDVRIGGEDAKPELSNFSWFTIALTTTMAAGVLFWGPGEPIAHYAYPPTELYGVEPSTSGSLKFAMETMFLHWTIVPYCMYTVPAVVFAFMYYNAKKPMVTSRLEKYRPETEAWLRKNHVKYNKLVMLDLPDMAARQRANCHASFKAKEYGSSTDYMLFVESSMPQAVEINRLTKKPVLCTETFRMIYESKSLYYNLKSGETCPWLRRFMIRVRNRLRALSPSKK